jgi:hypothetical protein
MVTVASRSSRFIVGFMAAALTALGASDAWAQGNPNPGVAPPNSRPYGLTYTEWAEKWWQWGLSLPPEQNPFLDPDGRFCDVGQSGPVFFLAGSFESGTVVRRCTVPAGKALLITSGTVLDLLGVDASTEAELRTLVEQTFAGLTNFRVEVDGVPLQHLATYSVESPLFSFPLPEQNVVGLPAGEYQGILQGIFVMLKPLPVGQHVIHLYYEFPAFSFTDDVTTIVTVSPHH